VAQIKKQRENRRRVTKKREHNEDRECCKPASGRAWRMSTFTRSSQEREDDEEERTIRIARPPQLAAY